MRFYWPIAKVDGEQRMVWGYASTEALDDHGEIVTRQALAAALDDYMRFANIREMHQNSAVGVAKEAELDDKGLYLAAKIVDDDAWRKVVEGVYKGFSIGGRVTARAPGDRKVITGLALTEISVVDRPANPEAVFDCWKLATVPKSGGNMANAVPARAPAQIWDCGVAGHRHLAKSAALQCIEDAATEESGDDDPHRQTDYADPGYQPDGRKRYPLDTERHIRAAWAFIHRPHNARRYTARQLEQIKARIIAAWQAKIDRNGPPAAATDTARKGLGEVARLAQIILDLDWLYDRIAAEAAAEADGSPLPQRLQQIIAELCDFIEALLAEESAELVEGGDGAPAAVPGVDPEIAAMAVAGTLRKLRRGPSAHAPGRPAPLVHGAGRSGGDPWGDLAPLAAGLAKLADDIVPRLDALQRRIEDIARTPLPPQTVARGFAGIAKREDGGGAPAGDEVVAALARMSDEERTLALIKAAHANPITSGGYRR